MLRLVSLLGLTACSDRLVVGELRCEPSEGGAPEAGTVNPGPLPAPWETSFEDGFCGYRRDAGFCYQDPISEVRLVTSPTRTGEFAALFDLGVDGNSDRNHQARCVREGIFPEAATYGAWYYIPEGSSDPNNWNLFHFQAAKLGERLLGTWDVNVRQDDDGQLSLYVANYVANTMPPTSYVQEDDVVPLPTDRWFHIEFYLKRSAEELGEIALFQDGQELLRVSDIVTDDSSFTQWYVGNFTISITPPRSTLYVDDVTIRLP